MEAKTERWNERMYPTFKMHNRVMIMFGHSRVTCKVIGRSFRLSKEENTPRGLENKYRSGRKQFSGR